MSLASRIHARGVPVGDVSMSSQGRDPTGTLRLSKDLDRSLDMGWRSIKHAVGKTVGEDDSFGLSRNGIPQFSTLASSTGQLDVFNSWLGNLQDRVFENLHPALQGAVRKGYHLGATQAQARVGKLLRQPLDGPGSALGLVLTSAAQDLAGITSAALQQSSRYFADGVLKKSRPQVVSRGVNTILDHVGAGRSSMLSSYAVVRAHAAGTLDALQALGVTHVGIVPERIPGSVVHHDHAFADAPVQLARIKLRVPRPRPTARTVTRALRAERKLERAFPGLVNVATQEDDRVCPKCQAISEDGPYTINEARGLIPNHVRCRCVFVPYLPGEDRE